MDICGLNICAGGRISAWTEREYPQSQLDTTEFLRKEAIPSITKAVILLSNNSMKAILSQRI